MAGAVECLRTSWRLLVILLTPFLALPLLIIINSPEGKCAYVVVLMAVYWITESMPIAVTSLLPVFMFPMLGIMGSDVASKAYMSDTIMVFVGGLMMAIAIERWNLHRRIALRILLLVGSEPRWILLGLMLATWFLSMWVSNTACTAMMIPITEAVLQQIKKSTQTSESKGTEDGPVQEKHINGDIHSMSIEVSSPEPAENGVSISMQNLVKQGEDQEKISHTEKDNQEDRLKLLFKGMSLSICYAANCGGIASLTGTGPNLVLRGSADKIFEEYKVESPITFASWMGFGLPLSLLVLICCWVWLQIVYIRCSGKSSDKKANQSNSKRIKKIIREEYDQLGPMSFAEGSVLFWFLVLVSLWITRDLGGIGGWESIFPNSGMLDDSTPAILIGVILVFFPTKVPPIFDCFRKRGRHYSVDATTSAEDITRQMTTLLNWRIIHEKMPWSLMLLLGGGFSLAKGCQDSGLSVWIGSQLEVFKDFHRVGMLFILSLIAAATTEVTSNTAIATLLMPILSRLAINTGVHPLFYMMPGAVACSFAFMLPVATPPNAIVFSYGHVRVIDMIITGFMMNLISVPILVLAVETWGDAIFDFRNVPAAFLNANHSTLASATPSFQTISG